MSEQQQQQPARLPDQDEVDELIEQYGITPAAARERIAQAKKPASLTITGNEDQAADAVERLAEQVADAQEITSMETDEDESTRSNESS